MISSFDFDFAIAASGLNGFDKWIPKGYGQISEAVQKIGGYCSPCNVLGNEKE